MKTDDVLSVIEAAYNLDLTEERWLSAVAQACLPLVEGGFGVCAFSFHYEFGQAPQITQSHQEQIPDALGQMYARIFHSMSTAVQARPFTHGPCVTGSQMMGQREEFRKNPLMQRFAQRFGMFDSLWITAAEPSGSGLGLHAGKKTIGWASAKTREQWARIATHLAAARRLRKRLAQHPQAPPLPEAVFTPTGTMLHAQGPAAGRAAQSRLRQAVRHLESARKLSSPLNCSQRLDAWPGLVSNRWSLVDHFESDGQRYVVARENCPSAPGPAALTLRERQIVAYAALGHDNKVIAYDLGIAHATVKVLMSRAAAKLGVRGRQAAINAYLSASGNRRSSGEDMGLPLEGLSQETTSAT